MVFFHCVDLLNLAMKFPEALRMDFGGKLCFIFKAKEFLLSFFDDINMYYVR